MYRSDHPWTRADFILALRAQLPDVAGSILDISEGLLHCEMSDFARCTHDAIADRRFHVAQQHLRFMAEVRAQASTELTKAILGSYLENVFIGESAQEFMLARELLSPRLKTDLAELEMYWARSGLPARQLKNPLSATAELRLGDLLH